MKSEKRALVPRLRFPEFRGAGDWQVNQLTEMATLHKGKGISKADIKETGSQPCIRYGELYTVYGDVIDEVVSKTDVSSNDLFMSRQGDVIIPSSGETKIDIATAACVLRENVALGSDLNVIRSEQNGVFLSYYLNGSLKLEIAKVAQGDTVVHLYKGNLEALKLAIPEVQEQQKIADCLSSLDALIAAQADKIDALKTHKKGLMQQLFPREGETVPRLRFPEFRGAGEWRYEKAGLLFSNRIEQGQDGLSIYSVTMNDGMARRDSLDRKIDNISESSGNKKAHKHDIIYNMMRMWQGASGVAVEDCMVSPAYVVLAPRDSICAEFFGYLFKTYQFLHILTAHSQGLTKDRLRLYFKDFAQILLPSPPVEEQKRIADCLLSLDEAITVQTEKLGTLNAHKKGLMQQLFPSLASGVDGSG